MQFAFHKIDREAKKKTCILSNHLLLLLGCIGTYRLHGPVAQLDRVFDYESKGRGFESRQAHQGNPCEGTISQGFLFAKNGIY